MIEWSKYFDAIYCLSLADNIERRKLMREELTRVGIMWSGVFHWKITVRNKFYKYIWGNKDFPCDEWWKAVPNALNCTMGHYEIMKEALACGFMMVLIIEDDVRFLYTLKDIEDMLENLPEYDICLFDKNVSDRPRSALHRAIAERRENDYYFDYSRVHLGSTGCMALNTSAMAVMTEGQEAYFQPADFRTNRVNAEGQVMNDDRLRRVASVRNLCVQDMTMKGERMTEVDRRLYEGIADLSEYQI